MATPRLTREERQAQILDAVLPVVVEHGIAVTSKQLAEVAGVAEGTLFKAFGDKKSLLAALGKRVVSIRDDANEWLARGGADGLTLEQLVAKIVEIASVQFAQMTRAWLVLSPVMPYPSEADIAEWEGAYSEWDIAFARFTAELSVPPKHAASALRSLVYASASAGAWGVAMTTTEIAQVFLHGVKRH